MLKQVAQGTPWPNGGYVEAAVIQISAELLASRLGIDLLSGVEPGLGAWQAVALDVGNAALVELIEYAESPGPEGFTVRIAANAPLGSVLQKTLAGLQLSDSSVVWLSHRVLESSEKRSEQVQADNEKHSRT